MTAASGNVFYNDQYTACEHAFDTTRKSALIAASLLERRVRSVNITDPAGSKKETEALLRRLHEREYLHAVKTGDNLALAQSQGFTWDEGVYTMALAHNTGLVAATDAVLLGGDHWAGTLSSGLHHASRSSGSGYCTFNGLAVAAQRAHDHGARRILVLDLDAHCGGGTYEMTRHLDVVQIDVSTSSFDWWKPDADDADSDLDFASPEQYLPRVQRALQRATRLGPWDFVLYNAGMDPFNTGVRAGMLRWRERLVAEWAARHGVPIVVTIAGGYTWGSVTMEQLVGLHRSTFEEFAAAA